jgi:hypothetical protein
MANAISSKPASENQISHMIVGQMHLGRPGFSAASPSQMGR